MSSITTNATMSTTAPIRQKRISVLDQPSSLPCRSPYTSRKSEPVSAAVPSQSTRPGCGLFDSSTRISVRTIAAIPIGMLTKKIQRQPAHSVRTPPTSGPIATAAPVVAPQMPNAVPRSRPWKAFASSASETANMIPPPTP